MAQVPLGQPWILNKMAYRRKSSSSRARKPTKRYGTRSAGKRKSSSKKRSYRKNPAMTRKRILNISSRKKRNTMMQYANTSAATTGTQAGESVTIGPGPLQVRGDKEYIGVWTPTAMDLSAGTGTNQVYDESLRTSSTCYIRGLSEAMRIETSSGLPWYWRRIVFKSRSLNWVNFSPNESSTTPPTQTNSSYPGLIESSTNGFERLYFNQYVNNAPQTISDWYSTLFKGEQNRDWSDTLTAPVDNSMVDLCSDKLMTIRSGNQSGTVKALKRWYPCNKNLYYADDESGISKTTRYFSVRDKRGMGDLHIVDIFKPGTGGGTADVLRLTSTATLYWHEK